MPNYVKFMKDILSKKQRLREFETITLTKECNVYLQDKIPSKMKNPGCFTIPSHIGASYCGKALRDLGASINLMPMSIFRKLGIDKEVPIILGRPFLEIRRTLIDVQRVTELEELAIEWELNYVEDPLE
ncbi:uncharacterized protein LOC105763192 [Gossypium raimondii]|uniref:uncharacterized protein LOC105763192 n=1 Tax=Gossypium raimondii TaxID=29730 RepID=UPI00063AFBF9|nr:uncharacterized protein LOC105763192 [Gossypium raimondii]